ncbi:hypothetical protein PG997_013666 [Apiospora hydei]|uniref:F-box domain-containing protein n=1 Tax=Apiospora hydei TaxID=1337664 RepID=A0ABR1VA45_9PEZI
MSSPVPYTPRMSRIEGLPDELILNILSRLSFDSFYCVAQCSRRLRAICRDRTYRWFRLARDALRQNAVSGHEWQALLQSKHLKDTMRFSPVMLAVALKLPTLWRLLPLIRKYLFCGECLEFRQQPQFVQNAKWLLTKNNYCMGCKEYHGAMLFPRDSVTWAPRDRCLAHIGSVRLCPHQQRDWAEIVRGKSEWLQGPTLRTAGLSFVVPSARSQATPPVLLYSMTWAAPTCTHGFYRTHPTFGRGTSSAKTT